MSYGKVKPRAQYTLAMGMSWVLALALATAPVPHVPDLAGLRESLDGVVAQPALDDNISYSFAVTLSVGAGSETVHVFAGQDNRGPGGSAVDADSLFPLGSVTKP